MVFDYSANIPRLVFGIIPNSQNKGVKFTKMVKTTQINPFLRLKRKKHLSL